MAVRVVAMSGSVPTGTKGVMSGILKASCGFLMLSGSELRKKQSSLSIKDDNGVGGVGFAPFACLPAAKMPKGALWPLLKLCYTSQIGLPQG